jgi:hypothetical protein
MTSTPLRSSGALGEHIGVDIDEMGDADVRLLGEGAEMRLPAPVDADDRDAQPVVRAPDLRIAARADRDPKRGTGPGQHRTTVDHRCIPLNIHEA